MSVAAVVEQVRCCVSVIDGFWRDLTGALKCVLLHQDPERVFETSSETEADPPEVCCHDNFLRKF